MTKSIKILLGLFVLLTIGLIWLESQEKDALNWNASYTAEDKIPLGAFVLYDALSNSDKEIQQVQIPPYEYLTSEAVSGTYLFLNSGHDFDNDELDELLNWVSSGNTVFISSTYFGENLADTLNFELGDYMTPVEFTSRPAVNLVNQNLHFEKDLQFDQDINGVYFSSIDTLNQVVLGTASYDTVQKVNFIDSPFGKGHFYLHTNPQVLSNYFLLKDDNIQYAENVLAYLSNPNIIWDAYYKAGKSFYTSPMYIFLNNRALKWAYYIAIIACVIFIIFEGKRKQRAIKVVEPLKNKTLEFTDTVSQMFMEKKDYRSLGIKKIELFLEHIRHHYRLDASNLTEDFYSKIASRSGNSLEDTRELFQEIIKFREKNEISKNDFLDLSKNINNYKLKNGKSGTT